MCRPRHFHVFSRAPVCVCEHEDDDGKSKRTSFVELAGVIQFFYSGLVDRIELPRREKSFFLNDKAIFISGNI